MRKALTKREIRTTWTLFLVCFCYFLFVMPIALVNILDKKSDSPQLHLGLFCLYWLQYSLNFFIYAARSEQYRKAYVYFLWKVKVFICGYKEETSTTTALFYVNKKMLPTLLKNYAEAQLPGDMASAIFHSWPPHISSIANHSNLSLAGSAEELACAGNNDDESAVIIVTR